MPAVEIGICVDAWLLRLLLTTSGKRSVRGLADC